MEYTARSIQTLLKDVKPFLKESSTMIKEWTLLTDENGREHVDTHYYMTNKYSMFIVPVGDSKFRSDYEIAIAKQKAKKDGLKQMRYERLAPYIVRDVSDYELATEFTLDFDPDWGPICHAKADSGLSKKINLNFLYPFEDLAKSYPDFSGYELYLKEGWGVVPIWSGELIGFVTPIYADKEGNNKP